MNLFIAISFYLIPSTVQYLALFVSFTIIYTINVTFIFNSLSDNIYLRKYIDSTSQKSLKYRGTNFAKYFVRYAWIYQPSKLAWVLGTFISITLNNMYVLSFDSTN